MKGFNSSVFNLLIIALLTAGAGYSINAQTPSRTPACPNIRSLSPDTTDAGQPLTITANVIGGDPDVTPTFNWSISAGIIISGQGTSTITVDTSASAGDSAITATVDVGGYDRRCSATSSTTTMITKAVEARKIDEYGPVNWEDEAARLDSFTIELQNDPLTKGYIVVYGGRKSRTGAAQKSATKTKTYLIKTRRADAARLTIIDGGYREEPATELWLVPSGATPPTASPSVDPTELKKAPATKKPPAPVKSKTSKKV